MSTSTSFSGDKRPTYSNTEVLASALGSINIPDLGKVVVSGLSLSQAYDLIKSKINTAFIGTDAYVTLVEVRDIQVLISGNAYNPGFAQT